MANHRLSVWIMWQELANILLRSHCYLYRIYWIQTLLIGIATTLEWLFYKPRSKHIWIIYRALQWYVTLHQFCCFHAFLHWFRIFHYKTLVATEYLLNANGCKRRSFAVGLFYCSWPKHILRKWKQSLDILSGYLGGAFC